MKSWNTALSIFGAIAAIVFVIKLIQGSDNPLKLVAKAVFTVALLWLYFTVRKTGPFGMLLSIFFFMLLSVVWWADIGEIIGGAIAGGLTGGSRVDKTALLSKIQSLRKTGRYDQALDEAQAQLTKFKNDFDCFMLIASIHAEDMDNLPVAASLIETILAQNKKLERKQICYALNTLADWHLKYGKDPAAAQAALGEIIERYPNSRASQSAESRIAHMADKETLEAAAQPKQGKVLPKFERDLGLKGKTPELKKKVDPNELTDQYLAQLEAHPNDWDTRERLAAHYIEHYQNVACAVEELEYLIRSKLAGKEDKCRWLHQIADWEAKLAKNPEAAKAALTRIIEKYPGTAPAQRAEQAIHYIQGL